TALSPLSLHERSSDLARGANRGDERLDVEVALANRRFAESNGLVGERHVRSVSIRVRVHGHRRDAEPPAGPEDAAGDLTAVGDQYLAEHAHSGRGVPSFTRSCAMAS